MAIQIVECKPLETDRLFLRKITLNDAKQMYFNWASDSIMNKYVGWDIHKTIEETKHMIHTMIEGYSSPFYFLWVVGIKDTNELIGTINTHSFNVRNQVCEVGYGYGSKYWNHGYASEALKVVIDFLFYEVGVYMVCAAHYDFNSASGRVMQKVGMKYDAVLRNRGIHPDTKKRANLIYYSITKEELMIE